MQRFENAAKILTVFLISSLLNTKKLNDESGKKENLMVTD